MRCIQYTCKPLLVVVYVNIIIFEQPYGVAPTTISNVFQTTLKFAPWRCNFVNSQNPQHLMSLINEVVHLLQFECNAPISIHDLSKGLKTFCHWRFHFSFNFIFDLWKRFGSHKYDDTTNCTMQINNILDYNFKTI